MKNNIDISLCGLSGIGRDRLIAELSPIFDFDKDQDGNIRITNTNQEFMHHHSNNIDLFLMLTGYYITFPCSFYEERESYEYAFEEPTSDVFSDSFVPDFDFFVSGVTSGLNDATNNTTQNKMVEIIDTLYRNLYNDDDLNLVRFVKTQYLVNTLSTVLDITENEDGIPGHITIIGLNEVTSANHFEGWDDMLLDLGYLPSAPDSPELNSFMSYFEEYINSETYYDDGFVFGQAVLRAFDTHIQPIDWFSHVKEEE